MSKRLIFISCLLALALSQDAFSMPFMPPTQAGEPAAPEAPEPIKTKFNFLDSSLVDLVWCGRNKDVLFILTEKNTLYRSADDGFSGSIMSEHLQKLGKQELGGADGDVGNVARIIQSPSEKNMLIMQGTHNINWITEDCGSGFRAMDQGRPVEEFVYHPTERNWLLASAWTVCTDFAEGEPCKKYKELFISKDLGGHWDLISDHVFQFSWGKVDQTFFRVPKERIIVSREIQGDFKGAHISEKIQIVYSDDFFKTVTPILFGGNKFLITSYFFFAVQYTMDGSDEIKLLVADPKVKTYTMRPIELPVKRLLEHSYTILDTSEHSVFLHVNHDGEKSTYGTIYVSDSTGVRYSSSLAGNVIDANGQCDFERVQGVEGIYLANVFDQDARKRFKNLESNDFPVQTAGTTVQGGKSKVDTEKKALNDFKKTMISFNKGGIWQPLTPPERDSDGKKIVCATEDECQLHLHSISNTEFGPFYTTENSYGLILGTGNIGKYLSNKADEINTYLSRDGGLTWYEVAKGSHIYEFGDHGSIIVMATDQKATKEVLYSWNEGLTWETLTISEEPIEITNIIIEPTNTAEKFLVYGRKATGTQGTIVAVDFTPLHKRVCDGVNNPDTPESDYETWTPNGKISPHCLLGKQITYTRRKRDAECFNKEDHERWRYVHGCECTEDDWECDYGYTRVGSGPCLPIDQKMANLTTEAPPPEECDSHYFITQGYRKVGGNACNNGISHDPIKVRCPIVITRETQSKIALVVMSIVCLAFVWKSGSSMNVEKVKGYFQGFKNKFSRNSEPEAGAGFARLQGEPDTVRDEEDMFGRIEFEETEERAEPVDENNSQELTQGKKMTERRAIETANKYVPTLHKPGQKKGHVNLLED